MDFKERLQHLSDIKKTSQIDLARAISVDRTKISQWFSGKVEKPQRKTAMKIAEYFGANINWVHTGTGEPFPTGKDSTVSTNQDREQQKKISGMVSITYFEDTYASAGKGIVNYDSGKEVMHFDRNFLTAQIGATNFENVHIIHAVGDSMAQAISPGDLLFVNPGDKEVVTGAVYVFVIGEETLVKRAERNPLTGELTLRSDNAQYSPIEISKEDLPKVIVVGRVMGNFKKF